MAPVTDRPQRILGAISWVLLVAVIFGGESLLRFLSGGDSLTEHREQFFRAGHGHAGVLTIVGLLYSSYMGKTSLSPRAQYTAWIVYAVGVGGVAGGMFLHAYTGSPGESSAGTLLAAVGGVIIAITVLYLAWTLVRHPAHGGMS
jgi:heme/copper-type cytochrome/quinol oxidase subunit 4